MREIKFKAKRVDSGEWVYGYPAFNEDWATIRYVEQVLVEPETNSYENQLKIAHVIPETVCQYTGLKDKNGVKIYEGDIIKSPQGVERIQYIDGYMTYCQFTDERWKWYQNGSNHFKYAHQEENEQCYFLSDYEPYEMEVIGNIHDKEGKI